MTRSENEAWEARLKASLWTEPEVELVTRRCHVESGPIALYPVEHRGVLGITGREDFKAGLIGGKILLNGGCIEPLGLFSLVCENRQKVVAHLCEATPYGETVRGPVFGEANLTRTDH